MDPEVQANQQVLHLPAVQKFQQGQANPEVLPVLDHLCRQVYQENLEFLHLLAVLDHPETQDYHFVLVVLVILVFLMFPRGLAVQSGLVVQLVQQLLVALRFQRFLLVQEILSVQMVLENQYLL